MCTGFSRPTPISMATINGSSAQVAPGPVTITFAQSHFGSPDPLQATIHNGLKASIRTAGARLSRQVRAWHLADVVE